MQEPAFPPVRSIPATAEEAFQAALMKRNQDLTPSQNETTAITNLVTKVRGTKRGN